jgi:hypothetical protein
VMTRRRTRSSRDLNEKVVILKTRLPTLFRYKATY